VPAHPARRPITLAAPPAIFGHFQDALTAFEEANDDVAITLDLTLHTANEAAAALARGRADIAYFYALGEPAAPPSRYGWSEPLNLYVGEAHALARAEIVSRADIARQPMLTMEPRNPLRMLVGEALAKAGLDPGAAPILETDNMLAIVDALRTGAGWFAAFGPMARDIGRTAGVRRIALDMPLPGIEVRQAVADPAPDPAARALADYLFL
ncbi:MAG: LysR family transcriptional regulator substrate-binding protein, partial [Sphingobium sp.]